jgi:hypothetical protein
VVPATRARRAVRLACAALVLAGAACGGPAADVYKVIRSGAIAGADVTLVPSEDGTVRCNGHRHQLPDPLLLTAENLADQLRAPATSGERLRSGAHPIYTYVVTTPAGTFSYSDDSPHQGSALYALQAWVRTVVRTVC